MPGVAIYINDKYVQVMKLSWSMIGLTERQFTLHHPSVGPTNSAAATAPIQELNKSLKSNNR
mgnify:CR=1 FL=1